MGAGMPDNFEHLKSINCLESMLELIAEHHLMAQYKSKMIFSLLHESPGDKISELVWVSTWSCNYFPRGWTWHTYRQGTAELGISERPKKILCH